MVLDDFNGNVKQQPNGVTSDIPPSLKNTRSSVKPGTLLSKFIESHKELESYRQGKPVKVDGQNLSIAAVTAAARHLAAVELDGSAHIKERVAKCRKVIADKVDSGASVYGLSTGFGGSADTRTDKPLLLGQALLQHQHVGVLPTTTNPLNVLPLQDANSTCMPEAWVRGTILVRMNSLIRGHSGVRWELIEKLNELLRANLTPAIPLRGSISASGDLSPLSYIAGTIVGNPSIQVFHGPAAFGARQRGSAREVLPMNNVELFPLASKEPLGILNGTAVSAAVGALALNDAVHLALLAQVCTAMGTEALKGTLASHDPFIHDVARPHPGQVECAENLRGLLEGSKFAQLHEEEVGLADDKYSLRQDRYPLRTSPQFLGPQIEDILSALQAVTQECNSTTDNPLIDGETGHIHHGGNFQAMAVTNAMEKTRLSLHHIGKIIFAQSTELMNPTMNNGLAPSLAATDPSLNYHTKGLDIATAAYAAELGFLATPVSTHIQSAEMHNQAVNSLALISARATITSLEVLTTLVASYLYALCQAVDLRALNHEFFSHVESVVQEELSATFGSFLAPESCKTLHREVMYTIEKQLDKTTTMDNADRMEAVAASAAPVMFTYFTQPGAPDLASCDVLSSMSTFRSRVSKRCAENMLQLREAFLSGKRGPAPASQYLGKSKAVYEYIRITLGVRMHGSENHNLFPNAIGLDDPTVGSNISRIFEAIRDGKLQHIIANLFA
ncbi:hypothetical protein AMATHDRAFT_74899 [Amanita thiersii Skay4041]|uniref:Phenylalanine ammonia-lyase n=1 Tax=Amanita thiersii Skay4041 TaxID=703135 RepID=A0A2A9NV26_9AGAR|nr:hypothetical protein AMATHDRAFT_74899 [Amanita thiersii Skay4041]